MPFFGSLATFGLSKLAVFIPPVVGPLTTSSIDAFVVKYNSNGIPLWARRVGGTGTDRAKSVSVDSSQNVIVAGQYTSNPLNIYSANGTTVLFTLTNDGSDDAFIVKYDPNGTPLWARRFGGASINSDRVNSVSTDSSGNVIVTGQYFSNPLNIYSANGSTVSFSLTSAGITDTLIIKYDSSGTPLWARRIGGTGTDLGNSVSVDSSGNIIVAGYYESNPLNIYDADGSTVYFSLSNSSVQNDTFIVKYDSSGTPLWARRLGGTGEDQGWSVSTDSSGNVIVTGQYASNPLNIFAVNGSTISFTLANSGNNDVFVVKYDSSGTPLWARRLGGTANDLGNSVSVDSSGNVVVAGYYQSNPLNIYAADGTTVSFTLANSGNLDGFVVKYDSSGTPLWARKIGGTLQDIANSVTTDSSGNIIVAGYHFSSLNIFAADGTTVTFTLANAGSGDVFVVKYDPSGTPLWARRLGGTSNDVFESVSTDSSGNIVVAGNYRSNPLSFS